MQDPVSGAYLLKIAARLSDSQREYAVRFNAHHRLWTTTVLDMIENERKSVTEAKLWADGAAVELRIQLEILRAEIAALETEVRAVSLFVSQTGAR